MGKGLGNKDFNSAVWDAGLLAQDYPTLLFQHTGHKVEDGQRGQVRWSCLADKHKGERDSA
jgi:hypothetical protein